MTNNIFYANAIFFEKQQKSNILNYDVIKTVWNSLGASDKGKNDVTSGYPADYKLFENVCY